MTDTTWTWATLDSRGLELVQDTENTLSADIVLAYREGAPRTDPRLRAGLMPAALDASQLECLRGVEQRLGVVVVAYQRG